MGPYLRCECCCQDLYDDEVSKYITCVSCVNRFHRPCVNIGNGDNSTFSPAKWVCPQCICSKPKLLNAETPVRSSLSASIDDFSGVNTRKRGSKHSFSPSYLLSDDYDEPHKLEVTEPLPSAISHEVAHGSPMSLSGLQETLISRFMEKIESEMEKLRTELKHDLRRTVSELLSTELGGIKSDISSLKDSISFTDRNCEDFAKKVKKVEDDVKVLKSKVDEQYLVKESISVITQQNNDCEQWSRRSNIEIYGIPERKNENLMSILKVIAEKTESPLNVATDRDFVTRVAPKSTGSDTKLVKPIVVRFLARYKKDDFLAHLKKLKLKASDLGFVNKNTPVYVNDHLTSNNKSLLQNAKKLGKEKGYKFVWVKNCCIKARRTATSPVIHITTNEDLKKYNKNYQFVMHCDLILWYDLF